MTETQLIRRQEAAKLLGVTPRTINRYVAAGRLAPTYRPYRGQIIPWYDPEEVLTLRAEPVTPE
jgi:excisionase family DNA binding protein